MNAKKVFIIVPVFNEDKIIEQTLLNLSTLNYNIIVVDDGSYVSIEAIAKKYKVFFLRHRLNMGQGAALRTGMTVAKNLNADIVVHFDADGQHDVNEIPKMIEPLIKDESDIVFGSRFLRNTNSQSLPFRKKIVLQVARYINWLFYGILLSDAHNGFRALNRLALGKITITQNRMAHASEILYLVKKNKLRYKEVPVTIQYSKYSLEKGQGILNSINILFDLMFKKFDR
jgi:glycosyltransferase involved in cell wall biosynthesis